MNLVLIYSYEFLFHHIMKHIMGKYSDLCTEMETVCNQTNFGTELCWKVSPADVLTGFLLTASYWRSLLF